MPCLPTALFSARPRDHVSDFTSMEECCEPAFSRYEPGSPMSSPLCADFDIAYLAGVLGRALIIDVLCARETVS